MHTTIQGLVQNVVLFGSLIAIAYAIVEIIFGPKQE